ncbi:hypothetical protein [Halogeometricum luteum]|nr:hypothetical protein [Halogeometricum sp. S3BR5-2]
MRGDDSSDADAPLTIELGADGGIVIRRTTALGTFSRAVER